MNSKRTRDPLLREFEKKNKHILKEHAKQSHPSHQESNQEEESDHPFANVEDTMTKTLALPKLKVVFDEEETKKQAWEKMRSTQSRTDKKP